MRFDTFVSMLSTTLFLGLFVRVAGSPLDMSLAPSLPSYLGSPNTFYRAITGPETAKALSVYPVGAHPTEHTTHAGDFSHTGGLYVFKDVNEAKQWGTCNAHTLKGINPAWKYWYLIEFQYTPNSRLETRGFNDPTPVWKQFVLDNYDRQGPHYDIIEGPISIGSGSALRAHVNLDGNMVWQAAFVQKNALATLVVKSRMQYDDSGRIRECCSHCNILLVDPETQFMDQSAANQWAVFE